MVSLGMISMALIMAEQIFKQENITMNTYQYFLCYGVYPMYFKGYWYATYDHIWYITDDFGNLVKL